MSKLFDELLEYWFAWWMVNEMDDPSFLFVVNHLLNCSYARFRFRITNIIARIDCDLAYFIGPCIRYAYSKYYWPYGSVMRRLFRWISGDPHYDVGGSDLIGVTGWEKLKEMGLL